MHAWQTLYHSTHFKLLKVLVDKAAKVGKVVWIFPEYSGNNISLSL